MFEGFYFEFPKLAFVLFFYLGCEALCKMRLPSIYFPHTARFSDTTAAVSKWLWFLKWLGITMLVISLMSPVKDAQVDVKPEQGYDIALILDTSESMRAQGFDPAHPQRNRFEAVQEIVGDFIKRRTSDNLGIVVFGAYSFVATPLTYDRNILAKVVEQLYIGMAGKFTALYEALAQSVNLLHDAGAKSRIAILLTDGYNTPGGKVPLDVALDLAKKEKVRLYTIGIGAPNEFNGPLLAKIAEETGGKAYGAQTAGQLKEIYKEIDTLEKSEIETNSYSYKSYYYLYPLFIAVLSLLLYVYLRNKRGWA
jgi:Ca-activated chloride channel family protein